jgi:hypothetical protein
MTNAGAVGVNVTAPLSPLHVDGDLRVTNGAIIIPPTIRTLSIPAVAFARQDPGVALTYNANGSVSGTTAASSVVLHASLNLPDGAFITAFRMHCVDNSASGNIQAVLNAASNATELVVGRASVLSFGLATGVRTFSSTASPATVANDTEMFSVRVNWITPSLATDIRFRGVTIEYQISAPLP